jgi:rare lipoprotein A
LAYSATYRRTRRLFACVPVLCTLVAVPTAALARSPRSGGGGGSGGSGLGSGGSGTTTPTTAVTSPTTASTVQVVHLSGVVNASGDGITLTSAASGTQGHPLTITGEAPSSDAGAAIDIESAKSNGTIWSRVATAVIASSGAFSAQWTPATSAQMDLRAVLAPGIVPALGGSSANGGGGLPGGSSASTASSELVTAPLTIPIFRNAGATIYGPGFWGHHTACGERLTRKTLGVASRTLRCGTRVGVFYKGREIIVPVIDRGPFANGATWDLTMATAKALGIKETVTVGTLAPAPAASS